MGALDISVEELLESAQNAAVAAEAEKATAKSADSTNSGVKNDHHRHSDPRGRDGDRPRSRRGETGERDIREGSDNASANGSVRSRRRSQEDRPRGARRPSRDRRAADSYRSSGGDFYRGGGRGRSRSPSDDDRHYRPSDRPRRGDDDRRRRDRERDRPAPRDTDRRDRDSHRGPRGRNSSPNRARTPEPTDDERDRRTVFVQQLAARLRTKDLEIFFSKIGPVKEAQIVKDRVSGRSKG